MGYIALIIVLALGGGFAYQQFNENSTLRSQDSETGPLLIDVLDQAKGAKALLEGSVPDEVKSNINTTMDTAILPENIQTMMVAGGCFWCVEADLEKLAGVTEVVSGYAGGTTLNPNYQNYGQGGHREVVEVTYDSSKVSFEEILIYALKHMDPTDGAGSFGDRGVYYSPAFYYQTEAQMKIIEALIKEVDENGPFDKAIAIAIEAEPKFYKAEDYHQDYYKGTLSALKYKYYRSASGRDTFIEKYWGTDTGATLPWRTSSNGNIQSNNMWKNYVKPSADIIKNQLEALAYKVTQEEGTERSFTSLYDKFWEEGIYVDILSGEPLFSSIDKFDSGTGWPSFVKPIAQGAVTEHIDKGFFSTRTEIRSAIADNHLGHKFSDGPSDRGGLRYCMNGVALRFVAKADLESEGYGEFLSLFKN